MKKQIFTFLLFSAILMQCQEELPVAQDFPIVITTRAIPTEQGFRFEGKLIDDGGNKILTHGFIYMGIYDGSRSVSDYLGSAFGAIVYELGNPGIEIFALNTTSVGKAPDYACRAFVTYMENSTKKTVYGNVLYIESKAAGSEYGWNLVATNEYFSGMGEGLAVATYYRGGDTPEAYFIQQDGKVTRFDIYARVISEASDFPVNSNQTDLKLYGAMPFVLNSQNNNVYKVQENTSWAISTQLPFDPEKLGAGDVYISESYPHVYIFGSFGTYLYNYRDNIWETRTTLPLSPGQTIVNGTNIYDQHYILTTDGNIQRFNGTSPPSLYTFFPGHIEGKAQMFFLDNKLFVSSGQKMWQFNPELAEWSEAASFPETVSHPIYFSLGYYGFGKTLYIANKNANGNYDIWNFGRSY